MGTFGNLLRRWRVTQKMSLGALALRAEVSKSTLSRWESGAALPRREELERTLTALRATPAQRAEAALTRAGLDRSGNFSDSGLPAPPAPGTLLRAMRSRSGRTLVDVAREIGASGSAVSRWERGDDWPAIARVHAYCMAVGGRPEEVEALTAPVGGAKWADARSLTLEEARADLRSLTGRSGNAHADAARGLVDLRYFALERALWRQAAEIPEFTGLLMEIYTYHALYLRNLERWEEAMRIRARAALLPQNATEPEYSLILAIIQGDGLLRRGRKADAARAQAMLTARIAAPAAPEYQAWMLSLVAKGQAITGRTGAAVETAEAACVVAERCENPSEWHLRRIDTGRMLLADRRPAHALQVLSAGEFISFRAQIDLCCLRAEAQRRLGQREIAQDDLRQAYVLIAEYDMPHLKAQADAVASRF